MQDTLPYLWRHVTLRLRLSADDAPKESGVAQAFQPAQTEQAGQTGQAGKPAPLPRDSVFGPDFDGIFAQRIARVLRTMLDEAEFLSPFGIRSLSRVHAEHPFVFDIEGQRHEVRYEPGESRSGLFGGNSNWRGPVWLPFNYLLIEALEKYHHFYGDTFRIECPTGSGRELNLKEVAAEIATRVSRLFLPDQDGRRPCHGGKAAPDIHGISDRYATHPAWRDLVLFHEYFHAETGQGLGASHQTGWTALVVRCLEKGAS